ncbi:YlxR family protein [Sorangium sp. So ce1151]|uniref:YlxR family protein n=1 Tax=Sorangium sp. So ce1151 TaxID=3133332 RepID=UPI003F632717
MSRQSDAGEREPFEKGRVRTCVGCGERVGVDDVRGARPLVRLILGPGGVIAVDPGDGGFGRGAHVHPQQDCLAAAVARGLARAAKGRVHAIVAGAAERAEGAGDQAAPGVEPLTTVSLARAIREATERRLQGLVRSAVRSQRAALGADAVAAACARGEAELVLVASDAAAGADLPEVRRAIADGRAVAWGSKQALGALAGGPRERGMAVMAISSASMAAAVANAVHVVDTCARVERGEDSAEGRRRSAGRRGRPARNAAARPNQGDEGGSPEPRKEAPGHAGPGPRRATGRAGVQSEHPRSAPRRAFEDVRTQPGSPEGAPASGDERLVSECGAGRLLATAPGTGEGGAVGGRGAVSGSTGRASTVDRVAANRRPRGWVKRIG